MRQEFMLLLLICTYRVRSAPLCMILIAFGVEQSRFLLHRTDFNRCHDTVVSGGFFFLLLFSLRQLIELLFETHV